VPTHWHQTIIAELGPDMKVFPTPGHLASWSGMCPDGHESAGKRTSGKTTKGSRWLRQAPMNAWPALGWWIPDPEPMRQSSAHRTRPTSTAVRM